jgi:SAM-dependent methyltransferase
MSYWDQRYLSGQTGWDIGKVSPPLQQYFDQLQRKDLSILIPGCGNSYEAGYLREKGFTAITLLDISRVVMTRLRTTLGDTPGLRLITGDFFDHHDQYDLIVEQTFFCALDPALRPAYVEQTARLLRPGGKLAGLLFDRNFVGASSLAPPRPFPSLCSGITGGPPFGGSRQEYQQLLEKNFTIKQLAPCYNSIKPRAGTELFLIARKHDS